MATFDEVRYFCAREATWDQMNELQNLINERRVQMQRSAVGSMQMGQRVEFEYRGIRRRGIVHKRNIKTVSLRNCERLINGKWQADSNWKVTSTLLRVTE